jgi:hypothetical protein
VTPCAAPGLWLRYARAPARDKVTAWGALLAAHEGRFIGQCSGSVVIGHLEPCDRGPACTAVTEGMAYLTWQAGGRPGPPLPWLDFQAAHGGRCHVPRTALYFGWSPDSPEQQDQGSAPDPASRPYFQ